MTYSIAKAGLIGALLALSACGTNDAPALTGLRLDPRDGLASYVADTDQNNRSVKISLGQQISRNSWTQVGANQAHLSGHNAFTSAVPQVVWTAPIGQGSTRRARLTTDPVAAGGTVFTLDTAGNLAATSASSGAPVWHQNVIPAGEKNAGASGGTLAISGQTLLVTSGYGDVIAYDRISGAEKWRQRLDAAGAAGLSVHDGLAYVVGADAQVWAIHVSSGLIKWQIAGPESMTSRVGVASPAINNRFAVVPFATGDLYGLFRKGGTRYWSASLAGQRQGYVYANTSDITSDPVISGSRFYVGNQSGRYAAFDLETGDRVWSANEGAYSPASVVGGSVFIVTDRNEIVRLSASTGNRIWGVQLPLFTEEKTRKRKAVYTHYGPVAAGGRLWVASSDGVLRGFAGADGALVAQVALPDGAASDPIVVGGVMYVLLADGTLAAIR